MSLSYLIVFAFLVGLARAEVEYTADVTTELGLVRGIVVTSADNIKVEAFRGIRFGKAGRFEIAKPATAWNGVYDATHHNYTCPQPVMKKAPTKNERASPEDMAFDYYSEDCLFLNVWRPAKASASGPRAVMVWIHGGAYIFGSVSDIFYQPHHLAALGDVIVVSINYRLGPFGFLNVGDEKIMPTNLGLQDQLLALKWIRENKLIESFGGDPNRVTVFGESAGGMAVSSQLVSPLSAPTGLFQRVIIQSGAFLSPDFIDTHSQAIGRFEELAARLGCSDQDHAKAVECLKTKTTEELTEAGNPMREGGDLSVSMNSFMPVYPSSFFPGTPSELIDNLNVPVDVMIGVTNDEGSMFVAKMINRTLGEGVAMNVDTLPQWINKSARSFRVADRNEIVNFYQKYASKTSSPDELKTIIGDVFGDFLLSCPVVILSEKIIQNSKKAVFVYNLKHHISIPVFDCGEPWQGTCHFADMVLLFGQPLSYPDKFSADDAQIARELINAWATFAKTGKPSKVYNVEWNPSTKTSVDYLHIEKGKTQMSDNLLKERCMEFWKPRILGSRVQDEL